MYNFSQRAFPQSVPSGGGGRKMRLIVGLVIAGFSLFSYLSKKDHNEITGEEQYVSLSEQQEIALGLQALPQLVQEYGGQSTDKVAQARVDKIGKRLLDESIAGKSAYQFDFHLLGDAKTINAFALPGGQIFITEALYRRLETEGQLAGVLGHEIGHVVARHGAERMAKQELTQGISGAVVMSTYDPNNPRTMATAQIAQLIGGLVNMKYGRDDELESDALGVKFMSDAGYNPRAMIGVMKVLESASSGGNRQPEFFSTHPNPDNRIGRIDAMISKLYPDGLPKDLQP
jgi:beta-barrel assembly-enhancing protease